MIATDERSRIWRHSSKPSTSGSIRSSSTMSGSSVSSSCMARTPSAETTVSKPLMARLDRIRATMLGSSSTTSARVLAVPSRIAGPRPLTGRRPRPVVIRPGMIRPLVIRPVGTGPVVPLPVAARPGAGGADGRRGAGRIVAEGVVQQVDEDLLQAVMVGPHDGQGRIAGYLDHGGARRGQARDGRVKHQPDVAPVPLQAQDPGLYGGEVEEVAPQAPQPRRPRPDPVPEPPLPAPLPRPVPPHPPA